MRSRLLRSAGVAAFGAALGIIPVVGTAHATDTVPPDSTTPDTTLPAPVVAESSTFTMPLFGAPLTVDVSTDPGGALASVALNPADGYTAVADRPNRVAFVNADGTATVRVSAGRKGDQVKVSGSALADILGPGGWSGDVFGDGTTTTVGFTVTDRGDGTPDITGLTSSDASATIGATEYHTSRKGSSARATVVFQSASQKRVLSISASVSTRGDQTKASLSATLSGARGTPQAAADAAGAHSWDGLLCDGTAAHIDYTVATDGSVSGVSATPDGATIEDWRGKTVVEFTTGEKVVVSVRERDGQITQNVSPAFRCDTADPSVNTPIDTTIPGDWGHGKDGDHRGDGDGRDGGDRGGWDHSGDRDGGHGGGDRGGRSGDGDGGDGNGRRGSGGSGPGN